MGIEKIEHDEERGLSRIYVHEPTPFGQKDIDRILEIPHDTEYLNELSHIGEDRLKELQNLPQSDYNDQLHIVEIPKIGKLAFVYFYDDDWEAATFRKGSHSVCGPYVMDA